MAAPSIGRGNFVWRNIVGKLDGQCVIVTGASRGIGEAIAKTLAAEGGRILCVARTLSEGSHDMTTYMRDQGRPGEAETPFPGSLEGTVAAIREAGGEATALAADLADPDECRRVVDEARRIYGPVDVLVNNAALAVFLPVDEFPYDSWLRSFQIIVHASFVLSQCVLQDMVPRKRGAIVNISSSAARGPGSAPYAPPSPDAPAVTGYGAAKAALERFTQGLALEVRDDNIAVSALSPSIIVPTAGAVFHKGVRYIGDENGEPPELMAQSVLLLATEPAEKMNGMVTYSQKILLEHGAIEKGVGMGVDRPGSGFSQI